MYFFRLQLYEAYNTRGKFDLLFHCTSRDYNVYHTQCIYMQHYSEKCTLTKLLMQ